MSTGAGRRSRGASLRPQESAVGAAPAQPGSGADMPGKAGGKPTDGNRTGGGQGRGGRSRASGQPDATHPRGGHSGGGHPGSGHPGGGPHGGSPHGGRGGPFAPSPWVKKVISPEGKRDTSIVALFRLGSALLMGAALVVVGLAIGAAYEGHEWGAWWPFAAGILALGAGGLAYGDTVYGGKAALREEKRIRAALLARNYQAASLPKAQAEEFGPARLIQMMTDNAERATEYRQRFSGTTRASFIIPFVTLGFVAMAFDPVTGLGIMALCPLIPVALVLFMRFFRKTSANSRRQRAKLAGKYLDAIRNLVTIRLLGAGPRIESDLREAGEANRGAIMKLLAGNQLVIIVVDGIFSLVLIVLGAAITVGRYHAGALSVGQAIAVVLLMVLMIEPLSQVAGFFYVGMGGKASIAAIGRYLTAKETAGGASGRAAGRASGAAAGSTSSSSAGSAGRAETGEDAKVAGPRKELASPALDVALGPGSPNAISLRAVSYDYGRGRVLDSVDLDVPRGAKIAIVGRSGGGKSTLLSLVRGSLPVQKGTIGVDGVDLSTLDAAGIRRLTASVSQSTWLFTGTVADNLRMAREDATEVEMWEALRMAHVAEDIERMPAKLDTALGESGGLISGGQAQRISLARAFLSGRKILLLDEPTSQVDIESEGHIIDALAGLGPDWTLLIVTHRHSLLAVADAAYGMDQGRLVRLDGTPAQA